VWETRELSTPTFIWKKKKTASRNMSKIILQCVAEGSKLRIKFYAFINEEGKVYKDAYNPDYNCQFPKDIREEGLFYEIPDINLTLSNGATPFYRVKKNGIKIFPPGVDPLGPLAGVATGTKGASAGAVLEPPKIFSVEECVVCLTSTDMVIMTPCGHQCACNDCYQMIPGGAKAKKCPLCRRTVAAIIVPK
jgi:hypothetical protein